MTQNSSVLADRHRSLKRTYAEHPERADTVKWAEAVHTEGSDTLHSVVHIGQGYGVSMRTGIDRAIGGDHDLPNPGDLLCAALAACADGTVRMIADVLGVPILDLRVEVTGDVDVRGCLALDLSVKVGFRSMSCRVHLRVPPEADPHRVAMLEQAVRRCCVTLDTLRSGVPVDLQFDVQSSTDKG